MRIIPLGVGGWIPNDSHSTSAFIIEAKGELIILDAGTGLSKLGKYNDLVEKYDDVHIILSHYHLDHIIGLSYLPKWFKNNNVTIWGPGEKYYGESCESILMRFTSPPYFSVAINEIGKSVKLNDYDEDGFSIGGLRIGIIGQNHSNPSFGITIDKYLHYATDTDVKEESFSTGSKLVFHECWSLTEDEAFGHTSLEALKGVSGFESMNLGLIHINPKYELDELNKFVTDNTFVVKEDLILEVED